MVLTRKASRNGYTWCPRCCHELCSLLQYVIAINLYVAVL